MKAKNNENLSGWLLFFVIIFFIFAANKLFGIFMIFAYNVIKQNLHVPLVSLSLPVMIYSIVISLILCAGYMGAAIGILKRKVVAKNLAIITIWLSVLAGIIGAFIGYANLQEASTLVNYNGSPEMLHGIFIFQMAFGVVISCAWAVLVTLYFVKSKQVKKLLVN